EVGGCGRARRDRGTVPPDRVEGALLRRGPGAAPLPGELGDAGGRARRVVGGRELGVALGEPPHRVPSLPARAPGRWRLTYGSPVSQKRHGRSVSREMPTRPETDTSPAGPTAPSRRTGAAGSNRSTPSSPRVMPSAWQSRPGPLVSCRSVLAAGRAARISSMPLTGDTARTSTAAPTPGSPVTTLAQAWMP